MPQVKNKIKSHDQHQQTPRMRHFSTLAGPLHPVRAKDDHTVRFKSLASRDPLSYRVWAKILAVFAFLLVLTFAGILFWPSHWVITQRPDSPVYLFNFIMLVLLVALQVFLVVGTLSATRATLKARDPVPMVPPKGLRVAFVTTRAPGEPIEMVRTTLEAAKRITYAAGTIDIWLLDETDDEELKAICDELGVNHFSRKGVEKWNQPKPEGGKIRKLKRIFSRSFRARDDAAKPDPYYAARTKHGNLNSWGEHISEKGYVYDILAGVDTDQVPEPNFLERMLGYFHDPDVGFVVGPQVYGNCKPGLRSLVARWSESQASFFQSTIQRAGNASYSPMFVGTNYAVRTVVLDQIKGFQPCITEDMATGIAIHSARNPKTNQHWKSVYTPDVLAVGEGPDTWGPYFTQQWRWAAGAFDTWRRMFGMIFFKTHRRAVLHYFLILTYYPIASLTWLLAVMSSMIYLLTGATAVIAPWGQFVSLYLMSVVMQLSLYFWNRRFNVSPHEREGSYGIAGMMISSLVAPVYLSALIGIVMGKKPHFVVTVKGGSDNLDGVAAFKLHLRWAIVISLGLLYGIQRGNSHPAMTIWGLGLLLVCLTPPVLAFAVFLKVKIPLLFIRNNTLKGKISNV